MKARYIILTIVLVFLLTVAGIFIYERSHASLYMDDADDSVSIIGGADGPTTIFLGGKLK